MVQKSCANIDVRETSADFGFQVSNLSILRIQKVRSKDKEIFTNRTLANGFYFLSKLKHNLFFMRFSVNCYGTDDMNRSLERTRCPNLALSALGNGLMVPFQQ